jgi:hypothetical protein
LFPKIDFDFKHPEETLIAASENHLVIAGRDRWDPARLDVEGGDGIIRGKQQEYGTANAVYSFLQDDLGVRWFWPGELGEDVPKRDRIAIAPTERRYHPQIRSRGGVFNYSRLGNKGYGRAHEWTKLQRLQLDSLEMTGGHGFGDWWNRYHETHPDIFALQPDGTRSGFPEPHNAKLCMSNPKVWELWLQNVAEDLAKDPRRLGERPLRLRPLPGLGPSRRRAAVVQLVQAKRNPSGAERPRRHVRQPARQVAQGKVSRPRLSGSDDELRPLAARSGEGPPGGQRRHVDRGELFRTRRLGRSRLDAGRHVSRAV